MPKFINTELKSDSESDSDLDLKKIETKCDDELEEHLHILEPKRVGGFKFTHKKYRPGKRGYTFL